MRRPFAALCLVFIIILTILQWIMPLPYPDHADLDGEVLVLEGKVWRKEYQRSSGQWGQKASHVPSLSPMQTEHSYQSTSLSQVSDSKHFYRSVIFYPKSWENVYPKNNVWLRTETDHSYHQEVLSHPENRDYSHQNTVLSYLTDSLMTHQNISIPMSPEQKQQDPEEKESMQTILYVKEISVPKEQNQKIFSGIPEVFPEEIHQVMVYLEEGSKEPSIGSRIRITGRVSTFSEAGNPGEFDSQSYYQIQKISFRIYNGRILASDGRESSWMEGLHRLRIILGEALDHVLEEKEASVMKAMLLGDKSSLDPDTKKIYQESSIIHILSISGLHISMIGSAVYRILRRLGLPLRPSALLAVVLILAYSVLTGMSMSGIRAAFMFILKLGADMTGRSYDLLTALSAAALLLLLEQPVYIRHSGFLFSFGAVAGIAVFSPVWEEGKEKKRRMPVREQLREIIRGKGREEDPGKKGENRDPGQKRIRRLTGYEGRRIMRGLAEQWIEDGRSSLLTCFSVFLVTLPIQLAFYYQFPIYSVLLNMMILPLMSILMGAGFFCMILSPVLLPAARIPAAVIRGILWFYEAACLLLEGISGSRIITGKPEVWQLGGYLLLLLALILMRRRVPGFWKLQWLTAALLLLLGRTGSGLQLTILDVGQGDSIHIRSEEGRHYLIDGGSSDKSRLAERQLLPYLKSQGVDRLEAVFVTHSDQDHCSGILELLETYEEQNSSIVCLVLQDIPGAAQDETYQRLAAAAMAQGIPVKQMGRGDRMTDGALTLTCLHPDAEAPGENANADSLVLLLSYRRFTALLTGDVEGEGERTLETYLRANPEILGDQNLTVLKVAHHGSDSSTEESLLELLQPKAALISSGKNNRYGHPHQEVVDRLEASGAMILQTAQQGAITIHTDGNRHRLTTFR